MCLDHYNCDGTQGIDRPHDGDVVAGGPDHNNDCGGPGGQAGGPTAKATSAAAPTMIRVRPTTILITTDFMVGRTVLRFAVSLLTTTTLATCRRK